MSSKYDGMFVVGEGKKVENTLKSVKNGNVSKK
jgi:hypothetical protein